MKVSNYIKRRFYEEHQDYKGNNRGQARTSQPRGASNSPSKKSSRPLLKPLPDHCPQNCEACLLKSWPLPGHRHMYSADREHKVQGAATGDHKKMEFIKWAFIDAKGEPCYVTV